MTTDEITLTQLHANRETLHRVWSERVALARDADTHYLNYYASGPVLRRDNSLTFYVYANSARVYDLTISAAGELTQTNVNGDVIPLERTAP